MGQSCSIPSAGGGPRAAGRGADPQKMHESEFLEFHYSFLASSPGRAVESERRASRTYSESHLDVHKVLLPSDLFGDPATRKAPAGSEAAAASLTAGRSHVRH